MVAFVTGPDGQADYLLQDLFYEDCWLPVIN